MATIRGIPYLKPTVMAGTGQDSERMKSLAMTLSHDPKSSTLRKYVEAMEGSLNLLHSFQTVRLWRLLDFLMLPNRNNYHSPAFHQGCLGMANVERRTDGLSRIFYFYSGPFFCTLRIVRMEIGPNWPEEGMRKWEGILS